MLILGHAYGTHTTLTSYITYSFHASSYPLKSHNIKRY